MKFLLTAFFLLWYSPFLFSQSITIQAPGNQGSFDSNTFSVADGTIKASGGQFVLGSATIANPAAWSFSPSNRKAAFLQKQGGVNVLSYNADGIKLFETNLEFFQASDQTINAYQFDNGNVVLRDNVANFSFFDPKGERVYTVSNSSGSAQGEKESEFASNPSGSTIVLYNPIISFGSTTGSRAQFVYGDQDTDVFFTSQTEEIKTVKVSHDGAFITILTNANKVLIYDRFGNELFQLDSDEDLIGATLHESAEYLTIYSGSRVQVYQVPGGQRVGSASSRSSILYAGYDPESQTIVALGGALNGLKINEPEITAVSISKRKIAREDVPFSISTLDLGRVDMEKSGSKYAISGLNRDLLVQVSF